MSLTVLKWAAQGHKAALGTEGSQAANDGVVSLTPPPVATWQGQPSGERFAALLRDRTDPLGVAAEVQVEPWEDLPGSFGVTVRWSADDAMFEVVDWVGGARVLDVGDNADVSVDKALDYLSARISGLNPDEAYRRVIPPRPSLWSGLLRRRKP